MSKMYSPSDVGGMPVEESVALVETPDGSGQKVSGGSARPLGWFPKPVVGCGLDSGSPAWRCFARFARDGLVPLRTPDSRFPTLGFALGFTLGLEPIGGDGPVLTDDAALRDLVDKAVSRAVENQTSALDRAISDISDGRLWDTRFPSAVSGRMDVILPRLNSMIGAMESSFTRKPPALQRSNARREDYSYDNRRTMSQVFKYIPMEHIEPYRARIRAMVDMDDRIEMLSSRPSQGR